MEAEIRAAAVADVEGIAQIAAAALEEAWSVEAFRAALAADGAAVIVAERAGSVVGYAVGRRVVDELEIQSLAVRAAERQRGIASRLLAALLGEQRTQGVRRVHLEVRDSNRSARALYARFGFREHARRAGYYRDGEDALVLAARL